MVLSLPSYYRAVDIDDSSVSSTLTVDRLDRCKALHDVTTNERPKKQLRFDLSRNIEYTNPDCSSDKCKDQWYNVNQYREFKATAYECAQQIIRVEARNRAPCSYQRVLEHTFNACLQANNDTDQVLPPSEAIHLQRWLEVASSRCGLEKWSIRKISRDKSTRRKEMAQTVLRLQYFMKTGNNSRAHNNSDSVSMDEFIRGSCENLSRPSRLYAQIMAQALAAAVMKDVMEAAQA